MRELLKFARPLSLVPEMFGGSMFAQVPIAPVENGAGFSLGALAVKALAGQVRALQNWRRPCRGFSHSP